LFGILGLAGLVVIAGVSCGSDDSDDSSGPGASTGKDAGSGGTGGSSGSGGASGTGGGAGTAGTGGSAGTSGIGGGAGASGTGGGAGAAGSGGSGLTCPAGVADCDLDPTNGCETDIFSSPSDCGACGKKCDGLCLSGDCAPFELLADSQHWPPYNHGIVFSDTEVFWVSNADKNQSAEKYRVQKNSIISPSTPVSIITNMRELDQIAISPKRLYFVGSRRDRILFASDFDGSNLTQEQTNVFGVQYSANRYYYSSNYNGAAYLKWKNVLTDTVGTTYEKKSPTWNGESIGYSMQAVAGYIIFAEIDKNSYRIYHDSPSDLMQQGSGSVTRLRYTTGWELLWVESAEAQGQNDVLKFAENKNPPVVVTQAPVIVDFAYQDPLVYVSTVESNYTEPKLSVIDMEAQTTTTYILPGLAASLEINGDYLYFFVNSRESFVDYRLVRLKLPI